MQLPRLFIWLLTFGPGDLQGVFLKPRFTRGTHTFDFPILLTNDYTNWRVVAGAYIVPPLTIYVTKRHIIRPLLRWRKLKQVQAASSWHTVMLRRAGLVCRLAQNCKYPG